MNKFYKPIGNKMCVFPVGAVYLTMIKENPSKYYGGTWELISGGYIYAENSTLGKTNYSGWGAQSGGSGTSGSTALSVDQIPQHNHYIYAMTGDKQWAIGYLWSRAAGPTTGNSEGGQEGSIYTRNTGGGKGHTHTIPNHSHNIATIDVFMYKRTA